MSGSEEPSNICSRVQSPSKTPTETFLHSAAATSSFRTAPQHKRIVSAHTGATTKPSAPLPGQSPATTIFNRPIKPVTAPAQPSSRPSSIHATSGAQPAQNVSPTEPATQQSSGAGSSRTRNVSIAAAAPDPDDDSSSSENDAGNNPSNRFDSSTSPRSCRRSQSVASIGTSVIGGSKRKITMLENNTSVGKCRQAAVFARGVDDAIDPLLIGNLDSESTVAKVWLGWHLEVDAKILHSSFRKHTATMDLVVIPFLTELVQFCIPFINKDKLWTDVQAIKHTHNGRSRPIQQVANMIKQMQILLPNISTWQCYHQLLEAIDPPLLAAVRPVVNDSMEWKELIQQYDIHDSVPHTQKQSYKSSSKHAQKVLP